MDASGKGLVSWIVRGYEMGLRGSANSIDIIGTGLLENPGDKGYPQHLLHHQSTYAMGDKHNGRLASRLWSALPIKSSVGT